MAITTRSVVLAVVGAIVAVVTILAVGAVTLAGLTADAVPVCATEDGSTQRACVFHGSDGVDYLNANYGATVVVLNAR